MIDLSITDAPFDPAKLLSRFTDGAHGAGAVVSFTGLVRSHSSSGAVTRLHLQAYSPMTERGINQAADRACTRWPLDAVRIVHRIGDMAVREPIVFVATASAHRRAAFEAADYLMDYLKTEAIFWKKEFAGDTEHWIEPRAQDYADQARWQE